MLRQINHYCSTCLRTRKFVDLSDRLVCQFCSKRLWRVPRPEPVLQEQPAAPRVRQLRFDAVG